jgi:glycosyltransferase involved in cell wall biosynthesis
VVPAYNEAPALERNLAVLCQYLHSLEPEYRWELIVVNDGSTDRTGQMADDFARSRDNVHVFHHLVNLGLGHALRLGFQHCRGDYIVTMDLDLSYSPDHIGTLLERLRTSGAKIVVASPYMKGGRMSNVPWLRRTLSIWANRFLSQTAHRSVSTVTGMVRAYDGHFLRSLSLKSAHTEINPEVIYKAMLLNEPVAEVPAHLDWGPRPAGRERRSSIRVRRQTLQVLLAGFLFRPVFFFIFPGTVILIFALYTNSWMVIHFFERFRAMAHVQGLENRVTWAVGAAFREYPYTFVIGLISTVLAIQLLSLGIVVLQSREYFREIFHLGTRVQQLVRDREKGNDDE